jgi:hypothetical protein
MLLLLQRLCDNVGASSSDGGVSSHICTHMSSLLHNTNTTLVSIMACSTVLLLGSSNKHYLLHLHLML